MLFVVWCITYFKTRQFSFSFSGVSLEQIVIRNTDIYLWMTNFMKQQAIKKIVKNHAQRLTQQYMEN